MQPMGNNMHPSLEESVLSLATTYRALWKIELCDSEDIEKYSENEYFGGKADAFEEALALIRGKI